MLDLYIRKISKAYMSSIYQKVQAVERVFRQLSKDVSTFQQESKLHCLAGCGKCCYKPDIEATVLEFLPFAYHVFRNGEALQCLERIKTMQNGSVCINLKTFSNQQTGHCTMYAHRGLICRLFGFSAVRDKHNNPMLATCRPIKEDQPAAYEQAKQAVVQGTRISIGRDYYMQMTAIDFTLANEFYPINQAISRAIETVLSYYSYRTFRFSKVS